MNLVVDQRRRRKLPARRVETVGQVGDPDTQRVCRDFIAATGSQGGGGDLAETFCARSNHSQEARSARIS